MDSGYGQAVSAPSSRSESTIEAQKLLAGATVCAIMLTRSNTCFLGLGETQGLENGFWILAGARHRPPDGFCLASFENGKLGGEGEMFSLPGVQFGKGDGLGE